MAELAQRCCFVPAVVQDYRSQGELLVILMDIMFNTQPNTMLWLFGFP